jgi:hypothetical protein
MDVENFIFENYKECLEVACNSPMNTLNLSNELYQILIRLKFRFQDEKFRKLENDMMEIKN